MVQKEVTENGRSRRKGGGHTGCWLLWEILGDVEVGVGVP